MNLLGADANSTLESTGYCTAKCNNRLIPDYIELSERQERVNLQETIRLFQAETNHSNIITNTTGGKFSWQALLIHGLHLSGQIQQEYQKIHSLSSVSHQKSMPIKDTSISPYHYYKALYSNSSDNNIVSPTLLNDSSTYEQDVPCGIAKAERKDILNKEPNTIDVYESLEEHQHAKSSVNSYIEIDQEVTIPVVVATSTSLMSKGWKYCLGGLGIMLAGAVIYSGYKWIMDKIGASEHEEFSERGTSANIAEALQGDIRFKDMNFEQGMMYLQKHTLAPQKVIITLDDLEYDHITSKDSKLGLNDIITSTMNRDFYNRYFYLALQEVKNKNTGITDYNQFIKHTFMHLMTEIQAIVQTNALMKLGPCEYLYQLFNITNTIRSKNHISLTNDDVSLINEVYRDISNTYIKNYTIYNIDHLLDEIKTFYKSIVTKQSNNSITIPTSIENIMIYISNNIALMSQQYKHKPQKLERAINAFAFDIYYFNLAFLKENDLDISFYKMTYAQLNLVQVLKNDQTGVSKNIISTLLLYYKVLPKIWGYQLRHNKEMGRLKNIYSSTISNYQEEVTETHNHNEQELDSGIKLDTGAIIGGAIVGGGILAGSKIIKVVQLADSIPNVDEVVPETDNHMDTPEGAPITTSRISEPVTFTVRYTSTTIAPCTSKNVFNQFINIIPYSIVKSQSLILTERNNFLEQELHKHPWNLYLDITSNEVPPYIQDTAKRVIANLNELKAIYHHVCNVLNADSVINDSYIRRYIQDSLDITSELVIKKAIEHIKQAACNGYNYVVDSAEKNFNNIVIASTRQIPVQDVEGIKYITTLRPHEIVDCPLAFTIPGSIEINIIADHGYYITPQYHIEYYRNTNINLLETLLHEISHITNDAVDFFYIPVLYTGGLPSAQNALDFIKQRLESGDPLSNDLTLLITQYIEKCQLPQPQFLQDAIFNLFSSTQILRANILCMNADNIAIYIRDIYKKHPYNSVI